MSLLELFCAVDDFCKRMVEEQSGRLLEGGGQQRRRSGHLSDSEALTIMIHFHQSQYRNFKAYYQQHVAVYLRAEFPQLISYARFVQRMPRLLGGLCLYLFSRFGTCTGISFVDATFVAVCDNRRINQHKVFKGLATRGKGSTGWSFGFKLHVVVNEYGNYSPFTSRPLIVTNSKRCPGWSNVFLESSLAIWLIFHSLFLNS